MKLCGVCIITNDVLRLVDFYQEVFGIQAVGDEIHSVFDDMQLAIWNSGDYNCTTIKNMSLMYYVDNVNYEYDRLSLISGIDCLLQPTIKPWGVKSFSFNDPDGNQVNFIEKMND